MAAPLGPQVPQRRAGLFERVLSRLVMRPARVSDVAVLAEDFRLIHLEGESLKHCAWAPGNKVQIKIGGGFAMRTYTPIDWDNATGKTRILAYCHGSGPGSVWARGVTAGDERQIFGPRGSLELADLATATVVFGDETSFGLAAALHLANGSNFPRHYVFEVNARQAAVSALDALTLSNCLVIERKPNDAHLGEVADAVSEFIQPTTTFVLSGKASSIQHLRQWLKARSVESRRLRTKAYWAEGKVGLD
jgi:ferric-chelate reductase (NADPH)